jgi:CheY-like chemotaxis protein
MPANLCIAPKIHSFFTSQQRFSRHYHSISGTLLSRRGYTSSLGRAYDLSIFCSITQRTLWPYHGNTNSSEEVVTQEAKESVQTTTQWRTGQPERKHILLVEDDQTLAALEASILTAHGYSVKAIHNGELAIREIQHAIPDLVVLDLELADGTDGWDVLQALRTNASIPVLITTSSAIAVRSYMHTHRESKLTLDHLPKPYPMQTFLKRVQRMLMIAPR